MAAAAAVAVAAWARDGVVWVVVVFNGERSDTVYVGSAAGRSPKTRKVFMPCVAMMQSTSS